MTGLSCAVPNYSIQLFSYPKPPSFPNGMNIRQMQIAFSIVSMRIEIVLWPANPFYVPTHKRQNKCQERLFPKHFVIKI